MKKLSRKNKIEMLIGRAVLNLIGGIIGAGLVLGFFALVGLFEQFVESHPIMWIPMIIGTLVCIFKMACE